MSLSTALHARKACFGYQHALVELRSAGGECLPCGRLNPAEVLILVLVATTQVQTLRAEVEQVSMVTALGRGKAKPELQAFARTNTRRELLRAGCLLSLPKG